MLEQFGAMLNPTSAMPLEGIKLELEGGLETEDMELVGEEPLGLTSSPRVVTAMLSSSATM